MRIIVTTRKVMAGKSRWLMGFPLDRCGFARAIAAILAPTSRALFPWNVPIVLNIQFSRSRNYFLLYTANMKFSLLAVAYFSSGGCRAAAAQRGLGRAPKISVWISKRYASKTICQQVGALWAPSFVAVGGKTGWESESCYDSLSAGISCSLRKSES